MSSPKRTFSVGAFAPGGLATTAIQRFFLTTGSKKVTILPRVSCDVDAVDIELYEDATMGAGGFPLTPMRMDRNDGETADFTVQLGAAVTAAGTLIASDTTVGNEAKTPLFTEPVVLKPNSTFYIDMENFNAGTARIIIEMTIVQDA